MRDRPRDGLVLLLSALLAGCAPGVVAVRQADPNPFHRGSTFAVPTLSWSQARIEIPALMNPPILAAASQRFSETCDIEADRVRMQPGGGQWLIRGYAEHVYPSTFAASNGAGGAALIPIVVIDMRVDITDAAGKVQDSVIVSGTSGGELEPAVEVAARNFMRYLRRRASRKGPP